MILVVSFICLWMIFLSSGKSLFFKAISLEIQMLVLVYFFSNFIFRSEFFSEMFLGLMTIIVSESVLLMSWVLLTEKESSVLSQSMILFFYYSLNQNMPLS